MTPEQEIIQANLSAVKALLNEPQCKYIPVCRQGSWQWVPDQLEKYRRRKKYRRNQISGFRKKQNFYRVGGRMFRSKG